MSIIFLPPIVIFCLVIGLFFGFIFGKHTERIAWNDLIQRGILPKPTKLNSGKF